MKEIFKNKAELFKEKLKLDRNINSRDDVSFPSDLEYLSTRWKPRHYESDDENIMKIVNAYFERNNDVPFGELVTEYMLKLGMELWEEGFPLLRDRIIYDKFESIFRIIGARLFLTEKIGSIISGASIPIK